MIGTKVKVRADLVVGTRYGGMMFYGGMEQFLGTEVTIGLISYKTDPNVILILGDEDKHWWTKEMYDLEGGLNEHG